MHNTPTLFHLRMPTSAEYDDMLRAAGAHNFVCHWHAIYTLCLDRAPSGSGHRIARGFLNASAVDYISEDFQNVRQGFRPFLEWSGTDPFSNIKVGERIHFGSLYTDGLPSHMPINPQSPAGIYSGDIPKYYGGQIELRNHIGPGPSIGWIKLKNGFIADRVLLCQLSWSMLKNEGFETGRDVALRIPSERKHTFSLYDPGTQHRTSLLKKALETPQRCYP